MYEDEPTAPLDWQWLYAPEGATSAEEKCTSNPRKRKASEAFTSESSRSITGVHKGDEQYAIGDAVRLKAPRNEQWVALIVGFQEDDDDEKQASFMWFTSPKEIRNKAKRRNDALSVRAN